MVDDLVTSPSAESQRHALRLAAVAFTMPYGDGAATIRALLHLPQPAAAKRGLLKVLAEAGETVPGNLVFLGIHSSLEEAKTKPWMLSDHNGWEMNEWLELLPFSDRATETIDALELLPRRREPWQMHSVLSALGRSPLARPTKSWSDSPGTTRGIWMNMIGLQPWRCEAPHTLRECCLSSSRKGHLAAVRKMPIRYFLRASWPLA